MTFFLQNETYIQATSKSMSKFEISTHVKTPILSSVRNSIGVKIFIIFLLQYSFQYHYFNSYDAGKLLTSIFITYDRGYIVGNYFMFMSNFINFYLFFLSLVVTFFHYLINLLVGKVRKLLLFWECFSFICLWIKTFNLSEFLKSIIRM